MATHHESALLYIDEAQGARSWDQMAGKASLATAYAVLALLDYLQQDDEPEPAAYRKDRENLIHIIEVRDAQIRNLKGALQETHAALRARDDALNTEMKAAKDE